MKIKLFEIPVYAMTKNALLENYGNKKNKLKAEHPFIDEEMFDSVLRIETYPQRLWEYNHVIGYIAISYSKSDVMFDIYLPVKRSRRYCWTSRRKIWLRNAMANGLHFRISDEMDSETIAKRVAEMVNLIITDYIPEEYYVDAEAFHSLNTRVDYAAIMKGENHGQDEI